MKIVRHLLSPLAWLYLLVTQLRNSAFSKGWLQSRAFDVPVVAIGNLSTGGTGKTPMTEYLLAQFPQKEKVVVSRGYGRKTQGCLPVNPKGKAEDFGDEPLQIAKRFTNTAVWVSEKRVKGIEKALQEKPQANLVVLDDAYQHRYVKAGFSVLLTTFKAPFFKDFVLPKGNLRESREGANRAQAIVVTKCPANLSAQKQIIYRQLIQKYSKAPVFFSTLRYGLPVNPSGQTLKSHSIYLLTGIANPEPLMHHLKREYQIRKHLKFKDHHAFNSQEIKQLTHLLRSNGLPLITTQKDWVRLGPEIPVELHPLCFVVPIEIGWLGNDQDAFGELLKTYINAAAN